MTGGRNSGKGWRARVASVFGSLFWLITVLSILEWSVAPTRYSDFPQARSTAETAALLVPTGEAAGSVVHAQLPPPPTLVEKRASAIGASPKGDADETATAVASIHPPERREARPEHRADSARTHGASVLAHAGARAPPSVL